MPAHCMEMSGETKTVESSVLRGHSGRVFAVAVLPDDRIVSGSEDKTIKVWNVAGRVATINAHNSRLSCIAVANDKVVSGSFDGTVVMWDANTWRRAYMKERLGYVSSVTMLGNKLFVGSHDKGLWVYDSSTIPIQISKENITSVAVSGSILVCGTQNNLIRVWSVNNLRPVAALKGHVASVTCVAILPGNQIVSGSIDSTVKVWNNAGVSRSFVGHKGPVTSVSVLRDGRVVSASIDRTIKVWNMVDRSSITLRGHSSTVRSVSVLSDGRIVSASDDSTLRVWSLPSMESRMRRARILKRRQMQKKKNKKDVKLVEIFEEGKRRFTGWKDQEECPICFEPLGSLNPIENKNIVFKRCGHVFHKKCILGWQKRPKGDTCPYCKIKGRLDNDIGDGIYRLSDVREFRP